MRAMKRVGIILLVIFGILILAIVLLIIYGHLKNSNSFIEAGYYENFATDCILEEKYASKGMYEVSTLILEDEDSVIKNHQIWYPKELENMEHVYPMIIVANASGTSANRYEPYFERLASWGFVVVGNQAEHTGKGEALSRSLDALLEQNEDLNSVFYHKIDVENIGIVGYSQGGAGAINAVVSYENGKYYKTIFTGSAAHSVLAANLGWTYDVSKISIPYFMTAGTLKNDTGEDGGIGVAPLSSLVENYDAITENVLKVRARATNADHEDMLTRTDGYMTAWMLYHLQGDEEAGKVFLGENAEILQNKNWQDIQISE